MTTALPSAETLTTLELQASASETVDLHNQHIAEAYDRQIYESNAFPFCAPGHGRGAVDATAGKILQNLLTLLHRQALLVPVVP